MTLRLTKMNALAALAGLAVALVTPQARGAVVSSDFDLDGTGNMETSVWSGAHREPGGRGRLEQAIHYGATDASRTFAWSGLGFKGRVGRVDVGETVPPFQIVTSQTTTLDWAEKAGRIAWTNTATNASVDGKARFFAPTITNAAVASGVVEASFGTWTNPIDGLVNDLTFKSEVKDGVITHTLSNRGSSELSITWSAAGITGKIKAGETLTATVNAPAGGIERRAIAVFQMSSPGVGVTSFEAPVHHWNKAPRVPAPGPLALAGLGAAALGARRRR